MHVFQPCTESQQGGVGIVALQVMMSVLSFYGTTRFVKEAMLQRFFCQEQRGFHGPGSDAVRAFVKELDSRMPGNVSRFIGAMQG